MFAVKNRTPDKGSSEPTDISVQRKMKTFILRLVRDNGAQNELYYIISLLIPLRYKGDMGIYDA